MSTDRLFVAIACYNRPAVAALCLPTVAAGLVPDDLLRLYNDGSTEYSDADLRKMVSHDNTLVSGGVSVGIDAQRRQHILDFWEYREQHGCTHLYFTDLDAIHDPDFRRAALALHRNYAAPICLYRTATHAGYLNNIYRDEPGESVIFQRYAPGVSYFLSLAHVEKIVAMMPEKWSFDWAIPGILGYKMAVSRVSYVDHIGWNGLHDRSEPGFVSTERALAPTEWLMKKRAEILEKLELKEST